LDFVWLRVSAPPLSPIASRNCRNCHQIHRQSQSCCWYRNRCCCKQASSSPCEDSVRDIHIREKCCHQAHDGSTAARQENVLHQGKSAQGVSRRLYTAHPTLVIFGRDPLRPSLLYEALRTSPGEMYPFCTDTYLVHGRERTQERIRCGCAQAFQLFQARRQQKLLRVLFTSGLGCSQLCLVEDQGAATLEQHLCCTGESTYSATSYTS
jgi:hypothetical protein